MGEFERQFARFVGAKHAVAVGSGRVGLAFILRALELPTGGGVALAALNTPIVPHLLLHLGLKPRFVDVDEQDGNLSPLDFSAAVDSSTVALIAMHLEGVACDVEAIGAVARQHGLHLIEDCAHACGTRVGGRHVGTFGAAGFFSFGLGKSINAAGGGMVVTDRDDLAAAVRDFRQQSPRPPLRDDVKRLVKACAAELAFSPAVFPWLTYPLLWTSLIVAGVDPVVKVFADAGSDARPYRSDTARTKRMSKLSASMGLDGLERLAQRTEQKGRHAAAYGEALGSRMLSPQRNGRVPSLEECCLRCHDPAGLQKRLLKRGIDSQRTWMTACHLLPQFGEYRRDCPVAERLAREILYLPNYPEMSPRAVRYVARQLQELAE